MHNGIKLNSKAVEVIDHLEKNSKKVVFLSNAPRPSSKVISFLIKMNMDKKFLKNVMTSGEAAMHAINQNKYGKSFFHLGPPRDISVFEKVKGDKTGIENCDFILCTGLFDEYENDLKYYETLLKNHINKNGKYHNMILLEYLKSDWLSKRDTFNKFKANFYKGT